MNLQKLAFHIDRRPASYCELFNEQEQDRQRHQRYKHYTNKLKFYETRRNNAVVRFVESYRDRIFEYTLEELQKQTQKKFPEMEPKVVNQEVQRMYEQEESKVETIKQNPLVLEDAEVKVKNMRKVVNEQDAIRPKSITIPKPVLRKTESTAEKKNIRFAEPEIPTDRSNISHQVQFLEERLNSMLEMELDRQAWQHQGPGIILEDDPEDLINKCYPQNRFERGLAPLHSDRQTSLPSFREDSILHAETITSGRTQIQLLQLMLKDLLGEEQGFSSRRSVRNIRIRKQILDRLYDYQGKLKLDLIKKVFANVKKDM